MLKIYLPSLITNFKNVALNMKHKTLMGDKKCKNKILWTDGVNCIKYGSESNLWLRLRTDYDE